MKCRAARIRARQGIFVCVTCGSDEEEEFTGCYPPEEPTSLGRHTPETEDQDPRSIDW